MNSMENCRGQLSVDLLLAIVVSLIFFTMLFNSTNWQLSTQAKEQNSLNEAKGILLDAYTAIGIVKANKNAEMNPYISPKPKQKENINAECKITIDRTGRTLKIDLGSGASAATYAYSGIDPNGIIIRNGTGDEVTEFACGESVAMARV
ncbi:Uncharacterised protein [uncultured archaeon]|nr:Uncharacterised protein [uncultured archaeon]